MTRVNNGILSIKPVSLLLRCFSTILENCGRSEIGL